MKFTNQNNLLKFFYKANIEKIIFEKTAIKRFSNHKEIEAKYISKKRIRNKLAVVGAKLPNNRILLVEDYPINFITSQTILVGEAADLVEFQIEKDEKKYIATRRVFENLDHIKKNSLKPVKPRTLYKQKFSLTYKQPEIVMHLKEYISKVKRINPDRIHLVKNDVIENFNPTAKNEHLELARNMNIPVIPLIEDSYLKETTINVHDTLKHIEMIKPFQTYEIKEMIETDRRNLNKVYKDVSTDYFIKFEPEILAIKIRDTKHTNVEKEKLTNKLKNIEVLRLTEKEGEVPIPLWKVHKDQTFIEIKDKDHFFEITGLKFKLDPNMFKDIYIQSKIGEIGFYKYNFIKEKFLQTLNSLNESGKIEFDNDIDLAFKVFFADEITSIREKENITEGQIKKLKNEIKKLIEKTIKLTVEYNKSPKWEKKPETLTGIYLENATYKIPEILDFYEHEPKKIELLNQTTTIIEDINKIIVKAKPKSDEMIFLVIIIKNVLQIFKVFDEKISKELDKLFFEFFKEVNEKFPRTSVDEEIVGIVHDILLANKLVKDGPIEIIEMINFDKTLLDKKVSIIKELPKYEIRIKPNNVKLKDIFPYSWKSISLQIKDLTPETVKDTKIDLGDKRVKVRDEFYIKETVFQFYTKIAENRKFTIVRAKTLQ